MSKINEYSGKDKLAILELLTGNQNVLSDDQSLAEASTTDFGDGFKSEYEVDFLYFIGVLYYFQKKYWKMKELPLQ